MTVYLKPCAMMNVKDANQHCRVRAHGTEHCT